MEREYLKDANDWVQWYNWHRSQIEHAPLERQVEFLQKVVYGQMKLIAGLIDQILLEKEAKPALMLPVGTKW